LRKVPHHCQASFAFWHCAATQLSREAAEQETLLGRSHTNSDPAVSRLTMPRAGSPVHLRGGRSRKVTVGQTWHLLKILTADGSKWLHIQHSAAACGKSDDPWQNSAESEG